MLEALFGNKTVEKVLIFLFVNGKSYGTQLQRQLKCPLTPIQKALLRLEKGGILTSTYEGKTRIYSFNKSYPFYEDLEPLLKKAYSLMPAADKRDYYVPHFEGSSIKMNPREGRLQLLEFWKKLNSVTQLAFHAATQSKENTGWNAKGRAEVEIVKQGESVLISKEKGILQSKGGGEMGFSNIFRWTLDIHTGMVSLEHLRRGVEHPIFLFNLMPSGPQMLSSIDSHLCERDSYFGQIVFDHTSIRLKWRVLGPKKNEEIYYSYY